MINHNGKESANLTDGTRNSVTVFYGSFVLQDRSDAFFNEHLPSDPLQKGLLPVPEEPVVANLVKSLG
jgi:hypothetical protein